MPNIQHSAITDPNIHEPKGITTASNRQVYKANGSGSGTWARLTEADLDFSGASSNLFGWNDIHYIIRVNCRITAAAAVGTPYICLFELQSAAGSTVVAGQTVFIKGGSNVNQVSFPFVIPMKSAINNQTLTIFVTPDTNINLYDTEFLIQRNYRESN